MIIHRCPLASAAGGGDRYSVGYSGPGLPRNGRACDPLTHRSVGVGGSSRTVHGGPRWPTFHSCQPGAGLVQRLGSSIGSSHALLALEDLGSGLSSGGLLASPSRWISLSTARAAMASPTRVNR